MYFLPLLFALLSFLLYPSLLLAGTVGLLAWGYLVFAGEDVSTNQRAAMRGKIAFRILSVKLLRLNGNVDENTYHHHGQLTADEPENSELRSDLRNAAFPVGDGWEFWAKEVWQVYRRMPLTVLDRYYSLFVQMANGQDGLSDESQRRLLQIAKMWGIGPEKTREYLTNLDLTPIPEIENW